MVSIFIFYGVTVKIENSFGVAMERDLNNWRYLSLFNQVYHYLSLDSGYSHLTADQLVTEVTCMTLYS